MFFWSVICYFYLQIVLPCGTRMTDFGHNAFLLLVCRQKRKLLRCGMTMKNNKKYLKRQLYACRLALVVISVLCLWPRLSLGDIAGSAHDFSLQSWSGGKICQPCHTPHGGNTTIVEAPLWNHDLSNATYTLYSSPTLDSTVEQPRPISKLCLSCHDGTVAIDSYRGAPGSSAGMMTGSGLIGTDLSDDHPISFKMEKSIHGVPGGLAYPTRRGPKGCTTNCHTKGEGFHANKSVLPFFDGYVECATCHDVHNGAGQPKLLRLTMNGSALCVYCHVDKS